MSARPRRPRRLQAASECIRTLANKVQVRNCGNAFFHRTTNAAGKAGRTTGSRCPARFPGCIGSPMKKRVPTRKPLVVGSTTRRVWGSGTSHPLHHAHMVSITRAIVFEKGGFWHNHSFPFQISKNLKKISYEPHRCRRNFSQSQTSKNLLRKGSRFCKNIL